ncbi:MAG: LD-carboxypeptidase [Candidatus Marinimicrobia bacterium]|nr:LD-carboxypeptidase [Candidatus Neomarinimicrobiota bacterium]
MTASPDRLKPRPLLPGGAIGIVSPSKWAEREQMEKGGQVIKEAGYHLVWGESTHARQHQFAGPPADRARELERMFADPAIDAIFCARGGYSAWRVVDQLDFEIIRQHPKIFMGYSDITNLLLAISKETGLVTFHGPMLTSFKDGPAPLSLSHLREVLSGERLSIDLAATEGVRVLRAGVGRGQLWGGNLYIVNSFLSTPRQLDTQGRVLFVEDVREPYHKLETMFQQLRRSGSLDGISGLIVGEIIDIPEEAMPFGRTVDEIVLEACEGLDIPIVAGVPCGHGQTILTFPISLPVELRAADGTAQLTFLEAPVAG